MPEHSYVAFVDPSGGSSDSMTLAISHREPGGELILDCLREVQPPFAPESAVEDFCRTLASYKVKAVHGDRYAGEWPREQFAKRNVDYRPSDRPKSDIYRDVLPLLNNGKIRLLDARRLIAQLHNLERKTSRGGKDSIDHPPRMHDDVANAVCGALLCASEWQPPMSFQVPLIFERSRGYTSPGLPPVIMDPGSTLAPHLSHGPEYGGGMDSQFGWFPERGA